MIDASSDSPFYGIYVGDKLVARMCLYKQDEVEKLTSQHLMITSFYGS